MVFVSLVFPEAKMLWQLGMKVFVLILPSRHEPLQKMACVSFACRHCGWAAEAVVVAKINSPSAPS